MNQPELATCHFLLPHPREAKFMVVQHSDGIWQPPKLEFPVDYLPALREGEAVEALLRNYGLNVTLLRYLQRSRKYYCVEVEMRPSGMTRKLKAVWVGRDEYLKQKKARKDNGAKGKDVFERWLDEEARGKEPPLRRPWERRGWFEHASRWMTRELERRGVEVLGAVRQVRTLWRDSSVLRVSTSGGNVYFKASAPDDFNEAQLTVALAAAFPNRVAKPLAVHDSLPWMLNADLGKTNDNSMGSRDREQLLYAMGDLQVKAAEQAEDWLELGVPRRSLGQLAEFLQGLDDKVEFMRGFIAKDERQFQALLARARKMATVCRDLAQSPVPESLVHPDFRPGNTFSRDGGFWIGDWGRTRFSHPFLALSSWARHLPGSSWSSYLDPFTRFAPQEELADMVQSTLALAPAYSLLAAFDEIEAFQPGEAFHETLQRAIALHVDRILAD